jgi:type I restriction enzyme S subunit
MSKQTAKTLLPRLRFPEFQNTGEWEEIKLGQMGKLVSGLTYSPDDIRDNGLLVLRSSNIQNGEISLKDNVYVTPEIKGANLSQPNDILICVRNGSKALIGKNALIPEGIPLCTHGAFMTVFRSQSAKFVFQLFQSSAYQSQVDADLGATINSINGSHFIKYKFYVPTPDEQQKVADCLSSIDELISAQSQKVDALKSHKKGLMQQLFPAEGETIPQLRFIEFRNAGEWELKALGEFAKVVASGDLDATLFSPIASNEHTYPVYSNALESQGLYGYYSTAKYPENSITITARGNLGFAFFRNKPFMGIGRLIVVAELRGVDARFLNECWNYLAVTPQEVTSIPQLTAVAAKTMKLPIPTPLEQQKIADCLSSIDELISAQSQKLDMLKSHKKGLMQQLFPSVDEVGV